MNGTLNGKLNNLSWPKVSAGLFALLLALVVYVWQDHLADFKELKVDVKAIKTSVVKK